MLVTKCTTFYLILLPTYAFWIMTLFLWVFFILYRVFSYNEWIVPPAWILWNYGDNYVHACHSIIYLLRIIMHYVRIQISWRQFHMLISWLCIFSFVLTELIGYFSITIFVFPYYYNVFILFPILLNYSLPYVRNMLTNEISNCICHLRHNLNMMSH